MVNRGMKLVPSLRSMKELLRLLYYYIMQYKIVNLWCEIESSGYCDFLKKVPHINFLRVEPDCHKFISGKYGKF